MLLSFRYLLSAVDIKEIVFIRGESEREREREREGKIIYEIEEMKII